MSLAVGGPSQAPVFGTAWVDERIALREKLSDCLKRSQIDEVKEAVLRDPQYFLLTRKKSERDMYSCDGYLLEEAFSSHNLEMMKLVTGLTEFVAAQHPEMIETLATITERVLLDAGDHSNSVSFAEINRNMFKLLLKHHLGLFLIFHMSYSSDPLPISSSYCPWYDMVRNIYQMNIEKGRSIPYEFSGDVKVDLRSQLSRFIRDDYLEGAWTIVINYPEYFLKCEKPYFNEYPIETAFEKKKPAMVQLFAVLTEKMVHDHPEMQEEFANIAKELLKKASSAQEDGMLDILQKHYNTLLGINGRYRRPSPPNITTTTTTASLISVAKPAFHVSLAPPSHTTREVKEAEGISVASEHRCVYCRPPFEGQQAKFIFLDIDGVLVNLQAKQGMKHYQTTPVQELFPGNGSYLTESQYESHVKPLVVAWLTNFEMLIAKIQKVGPVHIILSSAWRTAGTLEQIRDQMFQHLSFKRLIVGKTPSKDCYSAPENVHGKCPCESIAKEKYALELDDRAEEIDFWLREHQLLGARFVIIDDSDEGLSERFPSHFVHVQSGFSEPDVVASMRILGVVEEK